MYWRNFVLRQRRGTAGQVAAGAVGYDVERAVQRSYADPMTAWYKSPLVLYHVLCTVVPGRTESVIIFCCCCCCTGEFVLNA
eukprot:3599238-Rhodomonas_salina.1